MTLTLKIITLLWLTIALGKAASLISRGYRYSVLMAIFPFYVYYALPLAADIFLPTNQEMFDVFPGFRQTTDDFFSLTVYCLFISLCPLVWRLGRCPAKYQGETLVSGSRNSGHKKNFTIALLWVIMIAPLIYLLLCPDFGALLTYGSIVRGEVLAGSDFERFHATLSLLSSVALACQGIYIIRRRRMAPIEVTIALCVALILIYCNGKRYSFALWLGCLYIAFYVKGWLRRRLVVTTSVFVLSFVIFSVFYQSMIRRAEGSFWSYPIDYRRDEHLKFAIYKVVNNEHREVIEYPGQSLFFNLVAFIPRQYYIEKPYPYHVYLTAAAVGYVMKSGDDIISWGVTSSILDECLLNFGWVGFLVGPLLLVMLGRLADARGDVMKTLTITLMWVLLSVQVAALLGLFAIWAIGLLYELVFRLHVIKPRRSIWWMAAGERSSRLFPKECR